MSTTSTTNIPTPPSAAEMAEEQTLLRKRVEACLASIHADEIVAAIRRHDLLEDTRPQGWILDEAFVASPLDPRAVEAACRLWQALESTARLIARRDAVRGDPLVGALYGRLREVVTYEGDPYEDPALRRDLGWALPKAEERLAVVADEVATIEAVWAEAQRWLDAGWIDFLDSGSFPQHELGKVGAMGAEERREYLLSNNQRQALASAIKIFMNSIVARQGHRLIEDEDLADRWSALTGRPIPRPRQFGPSVGNGGSSSRQAEIRAKKATRSANSKAERDKRKGGQHKRG